MFYWIPADSDLVPTRGYKLLQSIDTRGGTPYVVHSIRDYAYVTKVR